MKNSKKKIGVLFLCLAVALLLSACGKKAVPMDMISSDKNYHYKNEELKFELTLPQEFGYYQTQRNNSADYMDLEVLIPTADTKYAGEISGYARPITVRVFNKDFWQNQPEDSENKTAFQKLGEKDDKVYAIAFWQIYPSDWQDKWNNEIKEKVIKGFKMD